MLFHLQVAPSHPLPLSSLTTATAPLLASISVSLKLMETISLLTGHILLESPLADSPSESQHDLASGTSLTCLSLLTPLQPLGPPLLPPRAFALPTSLPGMSSPRQTPDSFSGHYFGSLLQCHILGNRPP